MNAVALPVFDWRNPDYEAIYRQRASWLRTIRTSPAALAGIKDFYRHNVGQFITDWGITSDPRNALLQPPRPVLMPFVLFAKQVEWIHWVLERSRNREPGLCEKSRDCGLSNLAMAVAASLCIFRQNITIGVGSAKEDLVDRSGDPSCLFWKLRTFLAHLPPEFRPAFDSAHMRLTFPETGSAVVGEAGDAIGRGGRTSIFFLDEAAHIERPALIEASLSSNTDCRIDISSVCGMANAFAQKRHSGRVKVFTFHWRDDPRKDDAWYKRISETLDPVTLAQEIDISYLASQENALIPSDWIQSAIDAHEKLTIKPYGVRCAALDLADQGRDKNAFAGRHGILLTHLAQWSGKDRDIMDTVTRAFSLCDSWGFDNLEFDAVGVGAGVIGDARVLNERRRTEGRNYLNVKPFAGSAEVIDKDSEWEAGRRNGDVFSNLKSQAYWHLRQRFQMTHRAVTTGLVKDPDALIAIDSTLSDLGQLQGELSQICYRLNSAGKITIDKAPDGMKSPNLADSVMMAFGPGSFAAWAHMWRRLGE